jgi:Putative transposase
MSLLAYNLVANDRIKINAKGQVELKLKTSWRDGTTHHVMSPLEFRQRLAALVPRLRLHQIRFHGVWNRLPRATRTRSPGLNLLPTLRWGLECRCGDPTAPSDREYNNAKLQPKYSGCEGRCVKYKFELIDAGFQRYFCVAKVRWPKQTTKRAVRQSSLRAVY